MFQYSEKSIIGINENNWVLKTMALALSGNVGYFLLIFAASKFVSENDIKLYKAFVSRSSNHKTKEK